MRRLKTLSLLMVGFLIGTVLIMPVAFAAAGTENISRSYNATEDLRAGTIVSTTGESGELVEPTNTRNANKLIGVVVDADNSLVAVDPDEQREQVANSGTVRVLVSTVNGDIKEGDEIAVSPFSGLGMRSQSEGYVVGSALGNFTRSSEGAATEQVADKNGKTQTITVGYVAINLVPRFDTGPEGGSSGLQQFVRTLTGHAVSMPRIIISLIIAVVSIVAVVVLVYAAIYGSIISIGRNPLAQNSIFKALTQTLLMAIGIVGVAFVLVYLLLR